MLNFEAFYKPTNFFKLLRPKGQENYDNTDKYNRVPTFFVGHVMTPSTRKIDMEFLTHNVKNI